MLMIAAIFSFLDRQILTLLVQPIKADLHLSDTQIGLLQGFAFAVLFSVVAMPLGWLVDRTHRWRVAAAGVLLWSLATIGSGLSHTFGELFAARIAVGIGEASLMPAAYSLLADYYPPHQRGRVFGIYSMAIFAGGGGSLLIGGALIHALGSGMTALGPFGVRPLWQATFIVVGCPGLAVAAVLALMREPRQGSAVSERAGEERSGVSLFGFVGRHRRAFALVWGAYTLVGFAAFAVLPWAPVQLGRHFALMPATVGISVGLVQMIGGIVGALVCGVLADRWTRQRSTGGKFRLTLVMWMGGLPSLIVFAFAGNLPLALAALAMFGFFNTVGYVSASAVIQEMVPASLRGRVTGFWYLVTGILGNGAGPFATAFIGDHVLRDERLLGVAILLAAGPAMVAGLLVSLLGLQPFDRLRARVAKGGA